MALTIELNPEDERILRDEARRSGIAVEDQARRLLSRHLKRLLTTTRTLDLLDQWDIEDATDDPQVLAARRSEWEELRQNLETNRLELRGVEKQAS